MVEHVEVASPLGSPEGAVAVAYVHSNDVAYSWHHSLLEMFGFDMFGEGRIMRGGWIAVRYGTDGLVHARNMAAEIFLDERKAEWLLWLDTDMGFAPDLLERLLEAADPATRPIVGALAFSYRETEPDGMGGWRCTPTPTIFNWRTLPDGQQGFEIRWEYPENTVVPVGGTGSAAVLIHRTALQVMREKYGPIWYDKVPNTTTGQIVSEDLSMCLRAGALGIPIHVHTGVQTTHQKTVWVAEDDYRRHMAVELMNPQAPPAQDPTAVIVPVMRRPQNAAPFMESLRASDPTSLARVYVVVDSEGDAETVQAWLAAGVHDVILYGGQDGPGTFAQKVNEGYRWTGELDAEPWLFIVGDDVRFEPGWLDHAQHAARNGAQVIGTNDLHNPRVTSGEHATHLLIRRSYVDEFGASWDGPKVVAHEGYGHWYVDDEIVAVAKRRDVWAFAAHARVEHLHPLWGLAEDDEVYRLGQSRAEQDAALFAARLDENRTV